MQPKNNEMKSSRILYTSLLILGLAIPALTQGILADIEGDLRVLGVIDIHARQDTTTVIVGNRAGQAISGFTSALRRGDMDEENGFRSTFVGSQAGEQTFFGGNNSFFGFQAGKGSDGGSDNSFFGFGAGAVTLNSQNSFFGSGSGAQNTEGDSNSFYGYWSGLFNTEGHSNSFFGTAAGISNSTGTENTYIGTGAGGINSSGHRNTFIGSLAGTEFPHDSLNNAIALGYNSRVECDNCAVIGGVGPESVNVGIGRAMPESVLHIRQRRAGPGAGIRMDLQTAGHWNIYLNPNKKLNFAVDSNRVAFIDDVTGEYMDISDIRRKRDIQPVSTVLGDVLDLTPYTYQYNRNDTSDPRTLGLLAQDVQKVFPELISEADETLAIAYSKIGVIAIKAIQEQQIIINDQNRIIKNLEKRLIELEKNSTND